MPAIAVAALQYGLPALGVIGGATLSSRANNRATQASSRANAAALAYQKEQEAARRAEYDKGVDLYKTQFDDWTSRRDAILQKYGIALPPSKLGTPAAPPGAMPAAPGAAQAASPSGSGLSLAQLMNVGKTAPVANFSGQQLSAQGQPTTSAIPADWANWSRYGA